MKTCVTLLLLSGAVLALPVPVETADGLTLRIEGVDPLPPKEGVDRRSKANLGAPVRDASVPLPLAFVVSNGTARAVSGRLSAWMNDDWTVEGVPQEEIALAAGAARTFHCTAHAGKRVLPALYPVHASFKTGTTELHPVAVFRAKTDNRAFDLRRDILRGDTFALDESVVRRVSVQVAGNARQLANPNENDSETSGFFRWANGGVVCGGVKKDGYSGHPPYKTGAGAVWSVWPVELPSAKEGCRLRFSLGMSSAKSDGVGLRVFIGEDTPETTVYAVNQTETGRWVEHEVDLLRWAGRRTTIGIWIDTGPAKNTSFDGFCLSRPIVLSGVIRREPTDVEWRQRVEAARAKAFAALKDGGDPAEGRYRLELGDDVYGAGVVYGNVGLVDGAIVFTDGGKTLAVKGFECEVDGLSLLLRDAFASSCVRTRVWAEKGTLKVALSMPGVKRDGKGTPRFTRIAVGVCDTPLERVYAGMGNVIERPERFTMNCNGFACSTRHVGADYANGLSLVQASDIFPDEVVCDTGKGVFSIVTHHDATISFTPSRRGAFDAAIRFAAASGYRKSPGFDKLAERMVLDDWGGNYARAARGLPLSRKYGVDAVYLQHSWQRWGYDVRLPDIWPPKGDRKAFDAMCRAARESGTIFGLHDNYIDLYPDAPGFTYDDVYYTPDGLPHEAWYNPGPRILSYKWRPDAIWGWHSRNMKAMASEAGVSALFIDVFTASSPKDWYDRSGRFHTKNEQAECWAAAFDRARGIFGQPDAIMVSEAGHDALIGHLDAGEADHFEASRVLPKARFADSERVPWHDAVSHGKMVLLGGGLAGRYSGKDAKLPGADLELHGYASKDYLCMTVIGGRGAMCAEPFTRKGVETWWLLGDVLKTLAKGDLLSLEFGRDIHEQHSVFSTGEAWVNRSTNSCWNVEGYILPSYGLYAKAGGHEAGIVRKGGIDARFAKSPGKWFVDARPPAAGGGEKFAAATVDGFVPGNDARTGVLEMSWTVTDGRAGLHTLFFHFVPQEDESKISFFSAGTVFEDGKDALSHVGVHKAKTSVRVPAQVAPGEYHLRFGLYDRKTGARAPLHGWDDGTTRLFGGTLSVGVDGRLSWRPDDGTARTRKYGINALHEMVDFGGVATDGAFRLVSEKGGLVVTPLPGSLPFRARIDLRMFGAAGRKVAAVDSIEPSGRAVPPRWRQDGDEVSFEADANAFAYRLKYEISLTSGRFGNRGMCR